MTGEHEAARHPSRVVGCHGQTHPPGGDVEAEPVSVKIRVQGNGQDRA